MNPSLDCKNVLLVKWDADIIAALLKHSAKVTLICDSASTPWLDSLGTLKDQLAEIFVVRSFDSLEDLIAIGNHLLSKNKKFDLILSYSEYSQYAASLLGEILGDQEWNLKTGRFFRDKRSMKVSFKKAGINCADFQSIPLQYNDGMSYSRPNMNFPLVLKPANGFGSINTKIIRNEDQLQSYLQSLDPKKLDSSHYCAEEFIDGEEYHCDSVWRNGELISILISKYLIQRINILDLGRELNGSIVLDPSEYSELYKNIIKIQQQVMKESNIKNGVFHLEFFIQQNGQIVISEVANRMGGAAVCEVFENWFGVNLRNIWIGSLLGCAPVPNNGFQRKYKNIGWFSLMPPAGGKITYVAEEQFLKKIDGVLNVECNLRTGSIADLTYASASSILFVIGAENIYQFQQKIQNIIEMSLIRSENE